MLLLEPEIALHLIPFAAAGVAAIACKIKWMRDEKRIQREDRTNCKAAEVARKEFIFNNYTLPIFKRETWAEVRRKREYRERRKEHQTVVVKGALAAELPEVTE